MTPNEIVATINAARSELYTAHHVEADENKVHAVALRAFDKVVAGLNTLAVPTPEQWTEIAKQGSRLQAARFTLGAVKLQTDAVQGQDDVVKARTFDTIVKLVETWWQGEKNQEEVLV